MDFPKKQAQRLMPLYLLEYSEKLFENHPNPEDPWGGGGSDYTAGYGIDITNSEISVDTSVIATKSDIASMVTTSMLEDALDDYALKTDIPENVSDLNNDAGYTTQTWVENQNYIKNNDQTYTPIFRGQGVYVGISSGYPYTWYAQDRIVKYPGIYGDVYEYMFPTKSGTFAMTSDIPQNVSELNNDAGYITNSDLSGYATESWVQNQGYLSSAALSNVYQAGVELSQAQYKVTPQFSGIEYSKEFDNRKLIIALEDLNNWNHPTITLSENDQTYVYPGHLDVVSSDGMAYTLMDYNGINFHSNNITTTLNYSGISYGDYDGTRYFNLNTSKPQGIYTIATLDDIPSVTDYVTSSQLSNALSPINSNITDLQTLTSTHTSQISGINSSITSLESLVNTNTSNISTIQNSISSISSSITTLESLTSTHTSQISALQTSVSNCVTLSQLSTTLSDYALKSEVPSYSLSTTSTPVLSSATLSQSYETLTFTYSDNTTASFNFLTTGTTLSTSTVNVLNSATLS